MNNQIALFRESYGLTQSEFAKRTGLSQAAISQIESGYRQPSSQTLLKIAESFGVPIDTLLGVESKEGDAKKEMAIKSLVSTLQNPKISAEEIIALTAYFDVRLKANQLPESLQPA